MPIVKQSWVKKPEALEKYLDKDRDSEAVKTASDGLADEMASSIRAEHARHNKNVENLALTVIQSWSEKESDLFPPEKYNEMGQELAKRIAPGHLAWVVTHTEKNHIHNHITICSVNSETGQLLKNKRSELAKLHEANNAIALENGFTVLKPKVKAFEARLPQNAKSMVARGKQSWLFDMIQKADFASAASTSFDEYVGTLKHLGVHARVEEKNISYFYGDNKKAVRGKNLGTKFNKDGLMKAFKENDERFAKDPGLRDRIRGDIRAAFDGKGSSLGAPSNLLLESASYPGLGKKDHGKYTKIDRNRTRNELPAIFDERGGVLYQEMKKAREVSILDYCKEQKIQLKKNDKGQSVLNGKEFVVVEAGRWTNTRNKRQGTIIDFVAIHEEVNPLRAVAKINKNPRLLLLEPYLGEYKSGIQSFYFPKPKAAAPEIAKKTLQSFLNSRGMKPDGAESLLKSDKVHVGHDRGIWFIGENKDSAMEFRQEPSGEWRGKRHGRANGSFFESVGKSNKLAVYNDPFEFAVMKGRGRSPSHQGANILVLFGDNSKQRLDEIVAVNPHIIEINFIRSGRAQEQEHERRMEHDIKKRFDPFRIEVTSISIDPSRSRSRSPDISL